MIDLTGRIEASALWAAYGDALGFMTELADAKKVLWRTGLQRIEQTQPWNRKIGGFDGIQVQLPTGAYSDDTQLRLAVSRCINSNASFDVEAFAKIELPVWMSYALGAGRGTKDAASNLSKKNVRWYSNIFKGSKGARSYTQGGGNGPASRIQPHVWARAGDPSPEALINDVVRNSVTTHGHPHAILGAVFHSLCLREVLIKTSIPALNSWQNLLDLAVSETLRAIHHDDELCTYWLPLWKNSEGVSFDSLAQEILPDLNKMLRKVQDGVTGGRDYPAIVDSVNARSEDVRGGGTVCAILALALAFIYARDPQKAMIESANCLGSDTDTIATMAGALLGAFTGEPIPGPVQDESFIREDAHIIAGIVKGQPKQRFRYPSLLGWTAPKTMTDGVQKINEKTILLGLGEIELAQPIGSSRMDSWCWGELSFGQTVLVKRKTQLPNVTSLIEMPLCPYPNVSEEAYAIAGEHDTQRKTEMSSKFHEEQRAGCSPSFSEILDANVAFNYVRESNFDAQVIGELILSLAESPVYPVESTSALAALITKAVIERKKRGKIEG